MSKSYSKTRVLVECALMVAIGTVLANIKIFTMPNGGSVTLLSMLPFVLVSFRHGVKWGLFTGLVNGCLQMLLGFWAPPTPTFIYFLGEILLDYLVWVPQSSSPVPSRTGWSAWPSVRPSQASCASCAASCPASSSGAT